MILYSDTLYQTANITGATFRESVREVGTLELEFDGFGPTWLDYMVPVTLMHQGRVLFHGKITSLVRNAGGGTSTSVTVSNFLWLFDRLTLAQQIARAREEQEDSEADTDILTWSGYAASTGQITESWEAMAAETRLTADGWTVASGDVEASGEISLAYSSLLTGRACWAISTDLITTWSALLKLRDKAPDVQFIVDYTLGTVTAMAIGDMPVETWEQGTMNITDASGIAPQWESCVTGVCVLHQYEEGEQRVENGQLTTEPGSVIAYLYPPGLNMAQDGVKVLMVSSKVRGNVKEAARQYYEAASVLQWSGSITACMEDVARSPLGCRLNLTGPGMHESWASMEAVVSSCSWDLLTHEITVELGRDFSDPQFSDREDPQGGGSGGDDTDEESGEGGGGWENDSDEFSGSGFSGGTINLSESGNASGSGSKFGSGSGSGSSPSGSTPSGSTPSGSTPSGSTPSGGSSSGNKPSGSSSSGSGSGSAPSGSSPSGSTPSGSTPSGSTPSGSTPSGSTPSGSTPSGSTPGGSTPGDGSCGCSSEIQALQKEIETLKERLDKLEGVGSSGGGSSGGSSSGGGSSGGSSSGTRLDKLEERVTTIEEKLLEPCTCVEQVQSAINSVLSGAAATLGGAASQEVQQNSNGIIKVTASWSY